MQQNKKNNNYALLPNCSIIIALKRRRRLTMSIDGLFLHQIHKAMSQDLPAKINKVYCISDTELLLHCHGNRKNFKIMVSTHPNFARMNITTRSYPTPEIPNNFTMLLRKHLENGIILNFHQEGLDRVFYFDIQVRNEIGDKVISRLYIELMGKYANVILCDENGKIIDAMKRIPPYENSKRIIVPSAMYKPVEKQDKLDPLTNSTFDSEVPLHKQFHGFSPLLANEVDYRLHHGEKFVNIIEEITNSTTMYLYNINGTSEYHCIELKHLDLPFKTYDLMEGFDVIYYAKEEKDRIKQQTGDLFRFVRKELTKNKNKLVKLEKTIEDAYDCEKYRTYGDLLYAYGYQIEKGAKEALLPDFETEELVRIPLDPKFDAKYNAKKMYQKYNKSKNAQVIVAEQIELCQKEIDYFEMLEVQLEQANFNDAKEIRQELANKGYMKQQQSKIRKKKPQIPAFLTYVVDDVKIHVGKNNIQNEYLTWKKANKSDIWLHVKDMHGSHVIIETDEPSENVLRSAAMLAAYYSKGRDSSSVPVNYTPVKQLKRVPSAALGFVQIGSYKTIYIDPSEDEISKITLVK